MFEHLMRLPETTEVNKTSLCLSPTTIVLNDDGSCLRDGTNLSSFAHRRHPQFRTVSTLSSVGVKSKYCTKAKLASFGFYVVSVPK